ncbi:MipA/OmpV family protein [Vibrio cyclitrophicus]|uniref:MipA/OmpV family protein n=1 Tax=Vibrio cyclitrophicus TaxID=47951 RepID=UPI00029A63AE|nr:MipA/OmpV family protein [Vibrio cyclitrophicus]OEE21872.1 hypothetical protein OAM_21840 [Vibrio cyclitrophicus ZF14]
MNKKSLLLAISCVSILSGNASASEWSLGITTSYSPAVYYETKSNVFTIPMIGYQGEHFFLNGFSAGYRIFPMGSPQNIIFRVAYDPRTLKPEDSTSTDIKKLEERKATILGGATYQLVSLVGIIEFSIGSDIGNTHNGIYAESVWKLPIYNQSWAIIPFIGYTYNGEKINNHLYGVSAAESARTNFNEFDAGWNGQIFAGLSAYAKLTRNLRITGNIRYTNLEGELEKSPIVRSGINTSATIGVDYMF